MRTVQTIQTFISTLVALFMFIVYRFLLRQAPKTLHLDSFKEHRIVTNDTWNGVPNGQISIHYSTDEGQPVGDIRYRVASGQIGCVRYDDGYKGRGIKEQMLQNAIREMQKRGVPEVWEVTTRKYKFWANNPNAVYNSPVKQSVTGMRRVTGGGYSMKI